MNQKYKKNQTCVLIVLSAVALFHELQGSMSLSDLLTPDILIHNIYEKKRKDKSVTKIWDLMIRLIENKINIESHVTPKFSITNY